MFVLVLYIIILWLFEFVFNKVNTTELKNVASKTNFDLQDSRNTPNKCDSDGISLCSLMIYRLSQGCIFSRKITPPLLLKREGRDFLFDEGRGSPFLHFWFKSSNFLAARLIRWSNSGFVAVPLFPGFLAFVWCAESRSTNLFIFGVHFRSLDVVRDH